MKNLADLIPLRVFVLKDGDAWFAQGVDVDYFANGVTKREVENNFKDGLVSYIKLRLEKFGITKQIDRVPAKVINYKDDLGKPFNVLEKTKRVKLGTLISSQDPEFVYNMIEFIYLEEKV